jgi:hypothetical protein
MKTIQYSDPVIFVNSGSSVARDLTCGIDTRGTSYHCWVRYNWVLIKPVTGKDKVISIPIELRAVVPFALAEIADSALVDVIGAILDLIIDLPASYGGTSVLNLSTNEAIGALKAAFSDVMVIDLEDAVADEPPLNDPDFVRSSVT